MRTLRGLVARVVIALLSTASLYYLYQVSILHKRPAHAQEASGDAGWYATGSLQGHRAGSLYATYLGLSTPDNVIPQKIYVNWNSQLEKLWAAKIKSSNRKPVVIKTAALLIAEYRTQDPERMALAEYRTLANDRASLLYHALDWNKVGSYYFSDNHGTINQRKLTLLRNLSSKLDGTMLISYAMTELLPAQENGTFNYEYLDFLLQHGGRRFVEDIPAIYDSYASFGLFQFTSLAIYDVNGVRRGASQVNQALPVNYQIPGSVSKLRGNDHLDAAYLFAVHNMALLIASLSPQELQTLENVWQSRPLDIVEFIATAHNKPAAACISAHRWLKNHTQQVYVSSTSGASYTYASKTASNYRVLIR